MYKISEIKAEYLLIVFLMLMVLPFLILHYFNHPTLEDFYYGEEAKRIGFIDAQQVLYKFWGGRYFTYIFLSITPLSFKSMVGYKVFTLIMMLVLFYILFLFISEITRNSLIFREKFLISLSIFFLYLYAMPSVSEGFYWYGSIVCYLIAIILILAFSIFYMHLVSTRNLYKKIFYTLISCLSVIAIAGSVELASALIVNLIIFLMIKNFFVEKKFEWPLLLIALIAAIAVYIAFSAPGNFSRTTSYIENHKFFYSVYSSITFLLQKVFIWTLNSPLLAFTVLLIPIVFKIIKKGTNSDIFSINPIYSLVVCFIFLFSNIFIIIWSMGVFPYDRVVNFIYFVFLIGWFYNVAVLALYINKKFEISVEKLSKYVYAIAFIIIALFLIKENNIRTVYYDLLGGAAYKYNNEMNARYNYILQSNSDSCEVDSIKNIPRSFYYLDIEPDPNHFFNQGYALYFNKKSITLKKSNDQKKY